MIDIKTGEMEAPGMPTPRVAKDRRGLFFFDVDALRGTDACAKVASNTVFNRYMEAIVPILR